MEGRPLAKCVCPFSDRGRNAKGILEKMIEGLFGDYYSDAPNTIFTAYNLSPRSCLMLKTANMKSQPAYKTKKMSRVTTVNENPFRKKGDDNSHDTAALDRQGRRIIVCNEIDDTWANATFKSRNSKDKIGARGANCASIVHFHPTYTIMFMTSEKPSWHKTPKGSERDRIMPIRFPNKFVDKGEEAASPGRFPKNEDLDEQVREETFAPGLLAILVQRRVTLGAHLHNTVTDLWLGSAATMNPTTLPLATMELTLDTQLNGAGNFYSPTI